MTKPLRNHGDHGGLCRTSTALAPSLRCDGGTKLVCEYTADIVVVCRDIPTLSLVAYICRCWTFIIIMINVRNRGVVPRDNPHSRPGSDSYESGALAISPWARGQYFTYRCHLWWQRLLMIFRIGHVCAINIF